MEKLSEPEMGKMTKLAASALRSLSNENNTLKAEVDELKTKVAGYEKAEFANKIAQMMEDKGINPETSMEEKVASLMKRDDLKVVEEAVSMSSPQMKFASTVDGPNSRSVDGGLGGTAEGSFFAALEEASNG